MIRLAKHSDYLQLAEMRYLHAVEDNEVDLTDFDKEKYFADFIGFLKRENQYKIFVSVEGKKVISAMYIYLVPKIPMPKQTSKSIAYLTKVFTLKEYRHKGIGGQLLSFIKNYLKNISCELIFVWPSEESIKFYERNGFSQENDICECTLNEE